MKSLKTVMEKVAGVIDRMVKDAADLGLRCQRQGRRSVCTGTTAAPRDFRNDSDFETEDKMITHLIATSAFLLTIAGLYYVSIGSFLRQRADSTAEAYKVEPTLLDQHHVPVIRASDLLLP